MIDLIASGANRWLVAAFVLIGYALLCLWCFWRYRHRHPRAIAPELSADTWLLAYASQGGAALALAEKTQQMLLAAGQLVIVTELNRVSARQLQTCERAVFIVSTYGEGEAPDNGARFLPRLSSSGLSHLSVAILALGDSDYRHFCGFGHLLQRALSAAGARLLFDLVEVDRQDAGTLRHFQSHLGLILGHTELADWSAPAYEPWFLLGRNCVNPHSPGAPAFRLALGPAQGAIALDAWCAGDIVEIGPANGPDRLAAFLKQLGRDGETWLTLDEQPQTLASFLSRRELPESGNDVNAVRHLSDTALVEHLPLLPHREYSIASIPENGALELLVRQVRFSDGHYGLGSGWLTHYAALNDTVALRIKTNRGFHPPAPNAPMILIGNGTGMAGLRAHLLAREKAGAMRNWLLFGERTAAQDLFFAEDIKRWQANGLLSRADFVFSRESAADAPRYVQDLLAPNAAILNEWVAAGAAIFVCGSLAGMAGAVDAELSDILGRKTLDFLADNHRYCRDVY